MTIDIDHACGEQLDEQQNDEFADRRDCIGHHHILETDAYYKVNHHGYGREQHTARHSLAIEHQEERQVDQC